MTKKKVNPMEKEPPREIIVPENICPSEDHSIIPKEREYGWTFLERVEGKEGYAAITDWNTEKKEIDVYLYELGAESPDMIQDFCKFEKANNHNLYLDNGK